MSAFWALSSTDLSIVKVQESTYRKHQSTIRIKIACTWHITVCIVAIYERVSTGAFAGRSGASCGCFLGAFICMLIRKLCGGMAGWCFQEVAFPCLNMYRAFCESCVGESGCEFRVLSGCFWWISVLSLCFLCFSCGCYIRK